MARQHRREQPGTARRLEVKTSGCGSRIRRRLLVRREVMQNFCFTSLLYRNEMGHALGYQHVTRTLSMMSEFLPPALTDFDRSSIAILFQRRPGNRMPDRDPSGVSVSVTGSAARRDLEPDDASRGDPGSRRRPLSGVKHCAPGSDVAGDARRVAAHAVNHLGRERVQEMESDEVETRFRGDDATLVAGLAVRREHWQVNPRKPLLVPVHQITFATSRTWSSASTGRP